VEIDLKRLWEMHTRLPTDLAAVMVGRAALALERNGHASGVAVSLDLERILTNGLLSWPGADLNKMDQHDQNRITEDGPRRWRWLWPIGTGHGASFAACSARNTQTGSLRTYEKGIAK